MAGKPEVLSDLGDATVVTSVVALVICVSLAMFGQHPGGNQGITSWVAWHAILMTLGFPGLMTLGAWSYRSHNVESKTTRRQLHMLLMVMAIAVALAGYLCIFISHLQLHKFFGYDFKNHEWAAPLRIAHVYFGYGLIVLSIVQGAMGARKLQVLWTSDTKIFPQHGTIGKAIILVGAANVWIAALFWGWPAGYKLLIIVLSAFCAGFAVFYPRVASEGEGAPLVDKL